MKAMFDCGGNTTQQSAGVRRHEGNSLDPRKDNILKLMMQSSRFPKRHARMDCFFSYDLLRKEVIKKARSLIIPQSCFKASKGWVVRFMRRMGLVLRRRMTIYQMLPKVVELSAVHHKPEENGKFSDGANYQCQ
jgi:hypothetical protein